MKAEVNQLNSAAVKGGVNDATASTDSGSRLDSPSWSASWRTVSATPMAMREGREAPRRRSLRRSAHARRNRSRMRSEEPHDPTEAEAMTPTNTATGAVDDGWKYLKGTDYVDPCWVKRGHKGTSHPYPHHRRRGEGRAGGGTWRTPGTAVWALCCIS